MKRLPILLPLVLLAVLPSFATDCRSRIAVAYVSEDSQWRLGAMTQQQAEFWQKSSARRYSSLCLGQDHPRWLVLWSMGAKPPQGLENITAAVQRSLGPGPLPNVAVDPKFWGKKAFYAVMDLNESPAKLAKQGIAYQEGTTQVDGMPRSAMLPEGSGQVHRLADPVGVLKKALDWIKKN